MPRSRTERRIVILFALLMVALILVSQPSLRLTIIPGFEGLNGGVEGVEIASQFYTIGTSLPVGYSWGSADPYSTILGADLDALDTYGAVRVECRQPTIVTDPYATGKTVNYWVKNPDNTYTHVSGEIITYELPFSVSSVYSGTLANSHTFGGEKIWFSLNSVLWNRALQEQSPLGTHTSSTYGQAYETYLGAVITDFAVNDLGQHYYLDPTLVGRQFTLYTTPQQTGTISDLTKGNVNTTLAGDPRPDTRFGRTAYFAITLTNFGSTNEVLWAYNPVANYRVRVYALRIGVFTYTNPIDTPWAVRQPDRDLLSQLWGNIATFIANPFGSLTFWYWIIIGAIVLLVVWKWRERG